MTKFILEIRNEDGFSDISGHRVNIDSCACPKHLLQDVMYLIKQSTSLHVLICFIFDFECMFFYKWQNSASNNFMP